MAATEVRELADDIWAPYLQDSTCLRLQDGLPIEKPEDLTLEQYHADQARSAEFLNRLEQIDASQLSGDELIIYEILDVQLADNGAKDDDFWLSLNITAYIAPYNFQFAAQALAAQQINDAAAAETYLKLSNELADMIDQLVAKVEGQVQRGIYLPKAALPATRAIWTELQAALPARLRVSDERLAELSEAERDSFEQALEALMETRVVSGFARLLAALGEEYEAQAPDAFGLSQYPGGLAVYKRRVSGETMLELSPEEIHERGKQAVADRSARMSAIREESGFEDSSQDFLKALQSDPQFLCRISGGS